MAWDSEVVPIVRYIINDVDTPQKYSDSRIKTAAVIGGQLMLRELNFDNNYVVDVVSSGISPDPTATNPKDESFISLLSLKTSVLIVSGELRKQALTSVRIMDGPSSIDTSSSYKSLESLHKTLSQDYNKAKALHQMGANGLAIMTPFTNENINPVQDF